ncbi:hypothetical protein [Pontiella sp.]|uniref:hypothetical protein n=1 Tax=Pontiella sp. TaxID=2837462 RepID=UPI0035663D0D
MKIGIGWARKGGWAWVVFFAMAAGVQGGTGESFPIAGQSGPEGGGVCPAFDGTNVLVGIESGETNKLHFQFVDPDEGPVGNRIDLGIYGNTPQIGYGAGTYLLTWSGYVGTGWQLFGQRLGTDGIAIGSPFQISASPGNAYPSDIARIPFGNNWFLQVWQDYRRGENPDLYGRFVKSDGTLGTAEISIAVDTPNEDDGNYSMAYGDGKFLVVFSAERRSGMYDGEDVYGQLVALGVGRVGSNFVIDQNDLPSSNPTAVCWDGEKFTVLFHDALPVGEGEEQWDLSARFVSSAGVVATNRIAIADSPMESEMFPTLSFDGQRYLVSLTSFVSPSNGVSKARFYDKQLNPLTPWFLLAPTADEAAFSSTIPAGEGRFFAGTSYMVWVPSDDGDGDDAVIVRTDGRKVTPDAPRCVGGGIVGSDYTLLYSDLFLGTSNHLERIDSLTSTNGWIEETSFYCTTSSTNLTGAAPWPQQFIRLRVE